MIADRNDSRGRNADRGKIGEKDRKMGERRRGKERIQGGAGSHWGNARKLDSPSGDRKTQ